MFNRKQYIITLIALGVVAVGGALAVYLLKVDFIYFFVVIMLGYIYLKYRLTGPLQMFSTKFNMLVDYDLDVAQAEAMCRSYLENAPTSGLKAIYRWYLGMTLYYAGKYDESIRMLNQVDLKKMNPVYQVLIFVFQAYSVYELGQMDEFSQYVERIESIKPRIPGKYQGFVLSYLEILNALKNKETALDQFKEVVEKNFSRNDGYISTKLIYHYRLAEYYIALGDELEADKNLAFVIANGKEHHTAIQSKLKFKGLVNVEDYIYDPESESSNEEVDQNAGYIETQDGTVETDDSSDEEIKPLDE
jgi:tetratricopeptide (TPR) repeat protein